jgi:hypothetical protein
MAAAEIGFIVLANQVEVTRKLFCSTTIIAGMTALTQQQ